MRAGEASKPSSRVFSASTSDKHIAAKAGAQRHQSDVDHGAGPETGAAGGIIAGAMAAPNAFEELSRFLDEIGKLSDEDREMIDLIVVYGLTNQEAADTLGMSLSTFRRRYRDACCRLGELLDQDRR